MTQQKKILIVEDEHEIATIVSHYLLVQGFRIEIAADIQSCNTCIEREAPDFVILDLTLPDGDGIEFCRTLRSRTTAPILILSARSSDTDKVLALGFGADDYMTKPFSLSELTARVQAHLRRMNELERTQQQSIELMKLKEQLDRSQSSSPVPTVDQINQSDDKQATSSTSAAVMQEMTQHHVLRAGRLLIDQRAHRVKLDDHIISLSAKEFELLLFLASNPDQVFTKTQLLDHVWGFSSYVDDNTVTVYIGRLRNKLEPDAAKSSYIKTVWGVGYQFSPHEEKE